MPDGSRFPTRRTSPAKVADRLIVALDVPSVAEATDLVDKLHGIVFAFKVGFRLWIEDGIDQLIARMIREDKRVFLDAKMYDIGNTIEHAVRAAAVRGFSFITVHHNRQVVEAAVAGRGDYNMKIFVVTLLTSLDNENLQDMKIDKTAQQVVEWNTQRALDFGCDGVIASASDNLQEIKRIANQRGKDLIIAAPGIRPAGVSIDDHRRSGTPTQAIENGADYLIVGRPIYDAPHPDVAATAIIREMDDAVRRIEAARRHAGA